MIIEFANRDRRLNKTLSMFNLVKNTNLIEQIKEISAPTEKKEICYDYRLPTIDAYLKSNENGCKVYSLLYYEYPFGRATESYEFTIKDKEIAFLDKKINFEIRSCMVLWKETPSAEILRKTYFFGDTKFVVKKVDHDGGFIFESEDGFKSDVFSIRREESFCQ